MLKSLFIQNFVLIDNLNIEFENGFSVVTGETGAGKSIILGALGLVLGERADTKSIQSQSEKCLIEAVFDISAYELKDFFLSNDLEYDPQNCILRREILNSGKSRAFVNDTPAPLSVIKTLGDHLIDIHSQHQNLLLADTQFQLKVVDIMTQSGNLLDSYKSTYRQYLSVTSILTELKERIARAKAEEDYIRHQYDELKTSTLVAGEQEELEEEQKTLSHTEEIKNSLYKISILLNGEDRPVVQEVKESLSLMESLESFFPKAKEFTERLTSLYIDVKDLALEIDGIKEDIEYNPERLDWINTRLNLLYSLQQKHRVSSVDELIEQQSHFEKRLKEIDSSDEQIDSLTKEQAALYQLLQKDAAQISDLRKNASKIIEQKLIERMQLLGMPNTRFQIEFMPRLKPAADGMDDICFLFSANKNESLKPVAQTASGGEISRLMLCLKALIAGSTALPAIIFDEIDTGTSGEVADKMADIMQDLGRNMQVITITHLPQIAAKGNAHYYVYKEDTAERTFTRIQQLDMQERIQEIARMLSGATRSEASIANAKELLQVK